MTPDSTTFPTGETRPVLESIPRETHAGNYFVSNYPPFSLWSAEKLPHLIHELTTPSSRERHGLYVHLPFCRQRCHYCYFRVYPRCSDEDITTYRGALFRELEMYLRYPAFEGRGLHSVYFGGGSPSYLSHRQIEELLTGLQKRLAWDTVEECTFECEPGTVDLEKFMLLRSLGVTRLSLGFQTLNDEILRRSGRSARIADCMEAFGRAREAGFTEINIDLLAGLPGETEATWRRTIDQVLELLPDCVTVYQLELTYNSRFYSSKKSGRRLVLPDWPAKQGLVDQAFKMCEEAGYTIGSGYMAIRQPGRWRFVYTVENFWHGGDLLALGETAFGYLNGVHYQNLDTFATYTGAARKGHFPIRRVYKLNAEEKLRREVILQLKTGGLDRGYFLKKHGIDLLDHFEDQFSQLLREGLAAVSGNEIRLTREALLRVDWLLPLFYLPEHRGVRYT